MANTMQKLLDKLYKDTNNISAEDIKYPDPIPTGSVALNYLINGGIRPGGFYSFMGPEQSGKSLMALHCISQLLKNDPESIAFWFDCEFSFSEKFKKLFLPNKEDAARLIVRRSDPPTGATIFDYFVNTILGMTQDGLKIAGCVVDSIQTIIPPKEANLKSTENHVMGDLSSYLPKALRLISSPCKPRLAEGFLGIPWIFISQVRDELDPTKQMQGVKYHRSGGRSYGHSLDVEVLFEKIARKDSKLFDGEFKNMNDSDVQVGHRIRAKLEKNRFGPPIRVAEFDVHYSKGLVNQEKDIVSLAGNLGVVRKEGNTWFFGTKKLAVGEAATLEVLKENKALLDEIALAVVKKYTEMDNNVILESIGGTDE